jgi:membrane-bound lytic murein transglycosylase A
LDTTDPLVPGTPLRRLVIAQDTGGAIKGVVRGDYFWGAGDLARNGAGKMKQAGRFYILLPRGGALSG